MSRALSEGSWTAAQQERLGNMLSEAIAHGGVQKAQRRPMQTLQGFSAYLTEADVLMLQDEDAHSSSKLQTIVSRCVGLGLHLPSEITFKHLIATACDLGMRASDAEAKYRLLTELKAQLRQRIKHSPKLPSHLHLTKYPADPADLPQELLSMAYGHSAFECEPCTNVLFRNAMLCSSA